MNPGTQSTMAAATLKEWLQGFTKMLKYKEKERAKLEGKEDT